MLLFIILHFISSISFWIFEWVINFKFQSLKNKFHFRVCSRIQRIYFNQNYVIDYFWLSYDNFLSLYIVNVPNYYWVRKQWKGSLARFTCLHSSSSLRRSTQFASVRHCSFITTGCIHLIRSEQLIHCWYFSRIARSNLLFVHLLSVIVTSMDACSNFFNRICFLLLIVEEEQSPNSLLTSEGKYKKHSFACKQQSEDTSDKFVFSTRG